jgi:CHAD domain-containing protein
LASAVENANIPPHLTQRTWLEFEEATASSLCDSLAAELKLIRKKVSAKHVHDTRVALRRWNSVWKVLQRDGWRTKKFWQGVGKPLKHLRQRLGQLRDWDVNLEIAASLGVPEAIMKDWQDQRAKVEKAVRAEVRRLDIKELTAALRKFIRKRPLELRREIAQTKLRRLSETAYSHIDPFLTEQEDLVRKLEKIAADPITLHKLRLSIKSWRYLLTEFFGLTNIELVKGQQILGKYNDLHRILVLLRADTRTAELAKDIVARLEQQSDQLMKEFTEFRKTLPYGLRPTVISRDRGE